MTADVAWQLEGGAALLSCGPLAGRLRLQEAGDNARPMWTELTWQRLSLSQFDVLRPGVATDIELVDRYIRGNDLVAAYSQSKARAVAPQCYWRTRFAKQHQAAGIELVLSVQTSLLESQPAASVRSVCVGVRLFYASRFDAGEFTECRKDRKFDHRDSASNLLLLRHDSLGISYAEMVHPSDFETVQVNVGPDSRAETIWTLFQSPQLEKGVIRRARICGWFLPAENDLATAVQLARQFIDEPLPLTA